MLTLIDGRPELVEEARAATPELRDYIRGELTALREEPYFSYVVEGAMASYGPLGADRARFVGDRVDELLS